jgi:hypothetical protein
MIIQELDNYYLLLPEDFFPLLFVGMLDGSGEADGVAEGTALGERAWFQFNSDKESMS